MKKEILKAFLACFLAVCIICGGVFAMVTIKKLLPDYRNEIKETERIQSLGSPAAEENGIRQNYPWNLFSEDFAESMAPESPEYLMTERLAMGIAVSFLQQYDFNGIDICCAGRYFCRNMIFVFDCPVFGAYGDKFSDLSFVCDMKGNLIAFDFTADNNSENKLSPEDIYSQITSGHRSASSYEYTAIASAVYDDGVFIEEEPYAPYFDESLSEYADNYDCTVSFMAKYCNMLRYTEAFYDSARNMAEILSYGKNYTVYSGDAVYLIYNYGDTTLKLIWNLSFDCISGMVIG